MHWVQKTVRLSPKRRGCHLITREVLESAPELSEIEVGMLNVFIQHTSASLTLNENADPDVRVDMEMALSTIAPESLPYTHTCEGPDDMPAHVKASMMGSSVMLPLSQGRPAVGTWQGIYLCEHRDHAAGRRLVVTAWGEPSK